MRSARWLPYLLILPSLLFLLFFFVNPLVEAALLAFRSDGGWTLANFRRLAGDLYFGEAIRNTLGLTAVVVPVQLAVALGMGLLLGGLPRGWADAFLYIWTIPLGISDLAAGIAWLAIFTERGYLNSLLAAVGLGRNPQDLAGISRPALALRGRGPGGDLAGHRHRAGDPGLRTSAHSQGDGRGGGGVRCHAVAALPADHPPPATSEPPDRAHVAHGPCL